jgi:hypothetical protein
MRRTTHSPIHFALLSSALIWPSCYSLPHVDPGNRVIADFEEDGGDAGLDPTWNVFEPWFCRGITIPAQSRADAGPDSGSERGADAGPPANPDGGAPVTCGVELGGYSGHALNAPFDLVTLDDNRAPGVEVGTSTKSGTIDVTGFRQLLFTAQLGPTSSAALPAGTKLRVYLDCGTESVFTDFPLNMFGASWTPLSLRLDALLSVPDLSQNQTQICLVNVDHIRFTVLFGSAAAGTEIAGRFQLDDVYLK